MNSKKQKGGAAKERDKKIIKLQIPAQSCHNILKLFKKSTDQTNENINSRTRPISVFFNFFFFLIIWNKSSLMAKRFLYIFFRDHMYLF